MAQRFTRRTEKADRLGRICAGAPGSRLLLRTGPDTTEATAVEGSAHGGTTSGNAAEMAPFARMDEHRRRGLPGSHRIDKSRHRPRHDGPPRTARSRAGRHART